MRRFLFLLLLTLAMICDVSAASVTVSMNAVSTTMRLVNKETDNTVDVGEPTSRVYTFDAPAGTYVLTGIATDGETVNGTIEINITDEAEQQFTVLTCTAYVSNKTNGTAWTPDTDYTLDVKVNSREGEAKVITVGNSITAGRQTFLALNGNSYIATFTPSEAHVAEGYMPLIKSGTLTANVNVTGAVPTGGDFTITLPSDANLYLGIKYVHFTDFTEVSPVSVEDAGDVKRVTYHLANSQVYNYRTWKENGLTQAGYFTMSLSESRCPKIEFTEESYQQFGSKTISHDVTSNMGYETGDIFVNINEKGYLNLNVGDEYYAHAMRTWQLTDTQTNNYFMEPDCHYTVIGVDGKPSSGVITIDNADTTTSPWPKITAVGEGTAIVLVTYDAIGVNYYNANGVKTTYMGGEYWGAIWPENTAAYVVTVGNKTSSVVPNMTINEAYNVDTKKNAGNNVDAEHDVFYYLDTEDGFNYTFTPENVNTVELAYPTIGEQMATYTGFGTEGVTKNEDGSYTLLLKHGRQIVRLTDAAGVATYQVLTAKQCHRDIINVTRDGSNVFIPGDQVKVQYSGLFHPANKLAGIYNMSAYVTYNGVPNGTSLILGSGQYTFGSAASAQAVTVTIPADFDTDSQSEIVMDEGVIQVNGYGDPIGNHRIISRIAGRSPNFTAVAHKTYFGTIPEVRIPVTKTPQFNITVNCNVEDAEIKVYFKGQEMAANSDGTYTGTIGSYAVTGTKDGYRYYHNTFVIADDATGDQKFSVALVAAGDDVWDGKTMSQPSQDDEGVYQITSGAELAWFANEVSVNKQVKINGALVNDIDLGDYPWTAIAGSAVVAYNGSFDGNGNSVNGLYINNTSQYQGLFGYIYGTASVSNITVRGDVTGGKYTGGVVGGAAQGAKIDRCVNYANVSSAGDNTGGIAGYLNGAATTITNCYNVGNVYGTTYCGGIAGNANVTSVVVTNCYNAGEVSGSSYVAGCVGGSLAKNNVSNVYTTDTYSITSNYKDDNAVVVSYEQLASGEIAYKLGEAFGQEIGVDPYPVIGGMKVYYDEATDTYSNNSNTTAIDDIATDGNATVVGCYDINGRRLNAPQRGFNIVVFSDGTVKKQIVK